MELVLIPKGTFTMGSAVGEAGREEREGPQHEVTISQSFYMGKYTVTQEQYEAVTGDNLRNYEGPKKPVTGLSWNGVQEFCKKLSQKSGKPIALPSEAQWEYACRAGTATPFYFGNTISINEVNYNGNYGNGTKTEFQSEIKDVGSFKPNKFGLFDMHGNVCQWCQDYYGEYPKAATVDPLGPAQGTFRVLRGGSWSSIAGLCRSAYRDSYPPDARFRGDVGFRVVVSTPTSNPP